MYFWALYARIIDAVLLNYFQLLLHIQKKICGFSPARFSRTHMSIVKRHISGTNDYFFGVLRLPSHAACFFFGYFSKATLIGIFREL